jgi:amino acid adenylation domain-containing protein
VTVQGFRLSPQQRRIWSLLPYGAFETRAVLRTDDDVRDALWRLAARHEILRTTFHEVPGAVYPLQVIDEETAHTTLTLPALVADAATMVILLRELLDGPGEEPMQFADVAEWQNELLAEQEADWPACGESSLAGEFRPESVTRRRAAMSEAQLLAAWYVLLAKREQTRDVGWLCNGRAAGELRTAAGPLSRYLPLRLAFDDDERFDALAGRVAATMHRDAGRQEHFSWETALPSSCFTAGFDFIDSGALPLDELTWRIDRFDLRLSCHAALAGMTLRFEYDAARIDRDTVVRIADAFDALLDSARDGATIGTLAIAGAAERSLVVDGFNDTATPFALRPVAELVAPPSDAIAIVSSDETLTYAQLHDSAEAVAATLEARTRVALLLERGPEMAVATLAIAKAGAAWLPLNPQDPPARIDGVLRDAGAVRVLTAHDVASCQLPVARAFPPDRSAVVQANRPWQEDDEAYVLYTSGSTGTPKGVIVGQRALANHMLWMQAAYPLTTDDVVLQKTPYVFDASIWELWAPLIAGARLVMAPPDAHQSANALIAEVRRHGVTILQVVPTMLALLVAEPDFASCTTLRRVFAGGEILTRELVRRFTAVCNAELINLYGPTETTIQVASWRCDSADDARVPVGRPIANARLYVLDDRLRPRPIGARGEICIGGVPLANGYHGRAELTAERFIVDPFTGGRMYRTGDIGAWRADGALEIFGRNDDQVKVRGVRVELGEIDAAAASASGVHHAAVVHDRERDRLVCAYVADDGVRESDVRADVGARLPASSVPSLFVRVPELPRGTSGKTDRCALAALVYSLESSQRTSPPRDAVEIRLCRIWEQTLGRSQIGVTDSFFEVGGHSLLAVALSGAIEKEFGQALPLAALFTARTIEAQAALLRDRVAAARTPLVPIRTGSGRPLFLVHPTGGNVVCYAPLAENLHPAQPLYALQHPGLYDASTENESLEELAASYVAAIRTVQPRGPYLLGGWSSGGVVAYEMAQQLRREGEDIALLAMIDSRAPLAPVTVDDARLVRSVGELLAYMAGVEAGDVSSLDRLAELGRAARILLPGDDGAEMRRLFSVFRANVEAMSRYRPLAYPRRVTLFRATEAVPDRLAGSAVHASTATPAFGWESLAAVRTHDVPGHHLNMIAAPHVKALSTLLQDSIEDANRVYELAAAASLSIAGH